MTRNSRLYSMRSGRKRCRCIRFAKPSCQCAAPPPETRRSPPARMWEQERREERQETRQATTRNCSVFLTGDVYPLACNFFCRRILNNKINNSTLMRPFIIIAATLSLVASSFGADQPKLKDLKDKVSYSIGLNIGSNFKKQGQELNPDVLLAGIKDGLSDKKPALTEEQVRETMQEFGKQMQEKQKAIGEKNAADGAKFLAENKKKEGVKTTESGLQYKVIKEGTGPQPKNTDTVSVNYRGTLINGTEFDSSYKRGQPATFPVTGVIKGWTEALQMMKAGSKYQLFIPPELAYGERAVGGEIAANSTLLFDVELLEVKSAASSTGPSSSPK